VILIILLIIYILFSSIVISNRNKIGNLAIIWDAILSTSMNDTCIFSSTGVN